MQGRTVTGEEFELEIMMLCRVAKALGDRRADVAARSFGKPLGRITIEKISVR